MVGDFCLRRGRKVVEKDITHREATTRHGARSKDEVDLGRSLGVLVQLQHDARATHVDAVEVRAQPDESSEEQRPEAPPGRGGQRGGGGGGLCGRRHGVNLQQMGVYHRCEAKSRRGIKMRCSLVGLARVQNSLWLMEIIVRRAQPSQAPSYDISTASRTFGLRCNRPVPGR